MNGGWTQDGHTILFEPEHYGTRLTWNCPFKDQTFAKDADPESVPLCHRAYNEEDGWSEYAAGEDVPDPKIEILSFCNVGGYLDFDGVEEHVVPHSDPPTVNPFPVEYQWDGDTYVWRPVQEMKVDA